MQNSRTNAELLAAREAAFLAADSYKAVLKGIEEEILANNRERIENEFKLLVKADGTVKAIVDGIEVKGEIKKTVSWDDAKLRAIANEMDWEQVQRLFKIDFSIGEKIFNDIADPELKAKFAAARTVKYGEPKITLSKAA